ncbi:hypothetical protein JCM18920_1035 [Cutibacterium acnes JCM 18920]|nr:hypothetical protein JCM18920_1035 [Cutibacterium acnes JCM 18920]
MGMNQPARGLGEAQRCGSRSISRREKLVVRRNFTDDLREAGIPTVTSVKIGDLHEWGAVVEKVEAVEPPVRVGVDLVEGKAFSHH